MGSQHSMVCVEQLTVSRAEYLQHAKRHPEIRHNEPWYLRLPLPPAEPIPTPTVHADPELLDQESPR